MKKTKLSSLIKKTKISQKQVLKEGLINKAVAGILKIIYTGKVKEITNKIEPINKQLAINLEQLENNIKSLNELLDDPKAIEVFKKYGVDITQLPRIK